ncbi:MFS transporter [Amycolatopsis sp. NPDC059021]|uniref:MFS transporter n=1 Tax=Amycolatopsis sp. NPDC059021 TaxID=3346704 RepID=UPI00366C73CE
MVTAFAAFVLIGALQALYGPAIPGLREDFGLTPASAGLALSAHFVGALLGVLVFSRWYARVHSRLLLGACYVAMAAGAAGFVLAGSWPVALFFAFVGGVGFGGIDYGLNHMFAIGFGKRGTAMLNLLNAQFGIGSIVAPAVIAWIGPRHYPVVFLVVAGLTALLLLGIGGVRERSAGSDEPASEAAADVAKKRSFGVLAAFVVFYVLNIGLESGVGGWEPTHLEAVGYSLGTATTATAAYWLAMTLGRFAIVPVAARWPASGIVIWSSAGVLVCAALSVIPALAPFTYFGVGLFIAPTFPTGLAWLHQLAPRDAQRAGAYVLAASMVGGVVFPPLLGMGIEVTSVVSVPILLAVLGLACLALVCWIKRAGGRDGDRTRRRD